MMDEEEIKKQKAEALDNSELLDVHRWSKYPEVNVVVDQIYSEMVELPSFKGRPTIKKKHIKLVILDLYVKWLWDSSMYISYHRGSDAYRNGRYNKLHITKSTPDIVDDLKALGYLDHVMGHYGRDGLHTSHLSRMRGTEKLQRLFEADLKEEMVEKAPNTECIILRDSERQDIDYDDNDQTNQWRDDLYAYNNLLRVTHIGIPDFPVDGVLVGKKKKRRFKLNKHDKFVRRIFNNSSWEDGGRYFGGWWQRVPNKKKTSDIKWRDQIRINGLPTAEVDYSGLHIVLLYQLEGIDYWKEINRDPYEIDGLEVSERMRSLLKQVLLAAINASSREATRKAIQKEINYNKDEYGWIKDEDLDLTSIIDMFEDQHKPIQRYFSSGHGVKLQNLDSRIAEHVINNLTNEDIPVLCIHDSFIISLDQREKLYELMVEGFRKAQEEYSLDPKVTGINTIGWTDFMNDKDRFIDDVVKLKYDYPKYHQEMEYFRSLNLDKNYYQDKEVTYKVD